MSTENSVDPQLLEQTKEQIRSLVSEIAQLAKSDISPDEFYQEFLGRVIQALAAVGGVIWTRNETGALRPHFQVNLKQTGLHENPEAHVRHGRLLHQVMEKGEGTIVAPHSGAGGDDEAGNPTDFLLVLSPLRSDQLVIALVEVFQRPGTRPSIQRGYLRFLLQMCELAGEYFKTRELRQYGDQQALWARLDQFARAAHESLDLNTVSGTIANEGRRLIECDRVSVALRKGRHCRMEAISGQDTFDKRSNTVALLGRLATAVMRTGEAVWYSGDTSDMAPQVEEAVQAYIDDSHSKTVAVLPLFRPGDPEDEHTIPETVGTLIIEQIEETRSREELEHRVSAVSNHASTALTNALDHNRLFLMPLWRAIGHSRVIVQARHLPKTVIAVIAIALVAAGLVFWQADFELEGKGTLEPVIRRNIFAPNSGIISSLFVEPGSLVEVGDPLAQMTSEELEYEIEAARGRRNKANQELAAAETALLRNSGRLNDVEKTQLAGRQAELRVEITSLDKQLALLEARREALLITSDIAGEVIDWDLENLLLRRHVQIGQIIMHVVDPSDEWELEIKMPEDRMGYIIRAQEQLGDQPLKVTFFVATDPGVEMTGTVKEIHGRAEAVGEEGNMVKLWVQIDKALLPSAPRPGASVTAKVDCGKRAIGFVWFHDVWAFIQSRILFRL
jgi:hypothetical protein